MRTQQQQDAVETRVQAAVPRQDLQYADPAMKMQQPQLATRNIQDTTQRISQAMGDLQQSYAQKTAELRVVTTKLHDTTVQAQTQRKSIIELQVYLLV